MYKYLDFIFVNNTTRLYYILKTNAVKEFVYELRFQKYFNTFYTYQTRFTVPNILYRIEKIEIEPQRYLKSEIFGTKLRSNTLKSTTCFIGPAKRRSLF